MTTPIRHQKSKIYLGLKKTRDRFSSAHLTITPCVTLPGIGGLNVVCPSGARNRICPGLEFIKYVMVELDIKNIRSCDHQFRIGRM